MMDVLIAVWLITGCAIVGCLLISFYFWRKAAFVEHLNEKMRGRPNA